MKLRHFLLLAGSLSAFTGSAMAGWTYFSSLPSSAGHNQSYYVEASADSAYGYGMDLTIWKNGAYFASNSTSYESVSAWEWTSDSGPQTVEYHAEGWDHYDYTSSHTYASVSISGPANSPPTATIEVDGYGSGATIERPYGGSVNVTVRYKATDPDGNLSGIRPQVWEPSGYLNNNGGNFVGQSGGSGEVAWTVTLNQNGDWYFWTDAQDSVIAPDYVNSGPWGSGFRLNVIEAPPPNYPPVASVWANTSTLYTGETAQIYVRGQDSNGNARYFNLDQVSPLNCFYGPGDSFVSSQQPNNGWWDLGSDSGDYTRTVNMTFDKPGTYHWRGAAHDSAGSGWQYSPTNHVITVPNRDPSVSIQILNASQQVIGLDGNGRALVPVNSQFYIRVNGSDPDGRLLRLYSRINNPAGSGYAYEQRDVAGGSASWTFGPYNPGATTGVWDVWGHSEDLDNTGYQWQGGGWWGSQSPDIEVHKLSQTITFNQPPAQIYGDQYTLSATASSELGVSYTLVSGPATLSFGTLTFTGVGSVVVRASQGGDATYYAAPDVERTITVNPRPTTFSLSATTFTYNGSPQGPSVVPNPSGATFTTGGTLSATNAGGYTSTATATGNFAGSNTNLAWAIAKADQTITFNQPPAQTYGTPYSLVASAPGGSVAFSHVSGPATVSGNVVTFTGASPVTVRAAQAGNGNYNAAANVDRTITVNKAIPTINFPSREVGTQTPATYTVEATALSATLSGPAGADVPTGSITYTFAPDTPNGTPNTAVTTSTVLTVNLQYKIRASYSGDAKYIPAVKDATWTVTDDLDHDDIPGYIETQLGTDPNDPNSPNDTSNQTGLNVHRAN